jgi:hypothetical protein
LEYRGHVLHLHRVRRSGFDVAPKKHLGI